MDATGTYTETWFILPPWVLPAAGALLILAGAALVLWSDQVLDLLAVILGVIALLGGLALLAAGRFLGRAGLYPLVAPLAGVLLLAGILTLLRHDLVFGLAIDVGAALGILVGLALLLIGGLVSVRGPARWFFLGGGGALLAAGLALALVPAAASRLIVDLGGFLVAGAGCLVLLFTATGLRWQRRPG